MSAGSGNMDEFERLFRESFKEDDYPGILSYLKDKEFKIIFLLTPEDVSINFGKGVFYTLDEYGDENDEIPGNDIEPIQKASPLPFGLFMDYVMSVYKGEFDEEAAEEDEIVKMSFYSEEKLKKMLSKGEITEEEYNEIIQIKKDRFLYKCTAEFLFELFDEFIRQFYKHDEGEGSLLGYVNNPYVIVYPKDTYEYKVANVIILNYQYSMFKLGLLSGRVKLHVLFEIEGKLYFYEDFIEYLEEKYFPEEYVLDIISFFVEKENYDKDNFDFYILLSPETEIEAEKLKEYLL